jgi:cytochrome c-type biogenesis protein CcmH/NrfG
MAARRQLDVARCAAAGKVILALLLAASCALGVGAQERDPDAARLASAQQALDAERWEEAARLASGPAQQSAEFDFIQGLALARLERWSDARAAFEAGQRKEPSDPRFHTELAGVAYKQKNFSQAKRELRAALKLDSADRYSHEFLGAIFLLEGNLEAAVKYWNPIDMPRLANVAIAPRPRLDDKLLKSAVAFDAPQVLTTNALLATRARLDALETFGPQRLELAPSSSNAYDATLHTI